MIFFQSIPFAFIVGCIASSSCHLWVYYFVASFYKFQRYTCCKNPGPTGRVAGGYTPNRLCGGGVVPWWVLQHMTSVLSLSAILLSLCSTCFFSCTIVCYGLAFIKKIVGWGSKSTKDSISVLTLSCGLLLSSYMPTFLSKIYCCHISVYKWDVSCDGTIMKRYWSKKRCDIFK